MKILLAQREKTLKNYDLLAFAISQKPKTKKAKKEEKPEFIGDDGLAKELKEAQREGFQAQAGQIFYLNNFERKIALIGLGDLSNQNKDIFRKAGAEVYRLAQNKRLEKSAIVMHKDIGIALFDAIQSLAEGILLASYKFDKYITKEKSSVYCKEITIILPESVSSDKKQALEHGLIMAKAILLARDLINEGPSVLNPKKLADEALNMAKIHGLQIDVLDETRLKKERMNLLLAVGRAASEPSSPKLVRLSYEPKNNKKNLKTIAVIGKGVTFDSGGLNIKPTDGMIDMKVDMSGAAAVLAIMQIIAQLKPRVKVVGYMACVENGIGPWAYHQGDIIVSRKGLSVEITNTDAEGRLILADAFTYAIDNDKPDTIIDLATLTGACMVALGRTTAGIFSNDDDLVRAIVSAGKVAGEQYWRLPLSEDLQEGLKTPFADIKNCADRYGGAITAALFLKSFIEEGIAWAHLDIAGPATNTKTSGYQSIGGAGFGIRTVVDYIMGEE